MNIVNPPVFNAIITNTGQSAKLAIFPIGVWDMDTNASVVVSTLPLDLSSKTILLVYVNIFEDGFLTTRPLNYVPAGAGAQVMGGWQLGNFTDFTLTRSTAGTFDSVQYNDTGINRGHISVWYV
jgi:hypothetical protein